MLWPQVLRQLAFGTAAGSECSALLKAMPDIDVLLSQIARAKGAAAMIDTAIHKRFELMVAELQRGLAAIEQHPVSQRDSDKNWGERLRGLADRARLDRVASVGRLRDVHSGRGGLIRGWPFLRGWPFFQMRRSVRGLFFMRDLAQVLDHDAPLPHPAGDQAQ
jgi:hypothetical protein